MYAIRERKHGMAKRLHQTLRWVCLLNLLSAYLNAGEPANLLADRAAIERVYHTNRTGNRQAFEETVRPEDLLRLVQLDQFKESVLKQTCGLEIQSSQIQAEVARINRETRAPQILAELKAALGNDPDRFGRAVIKPLLVDRALREWFENNPQLHLEQRSKLEALRATLLERRHGQEGVSAQLRAMREAVTTSPTETTWRLPATTTSDDQPGKQPGTRSFTELHMELRTVLETQLRGPGDVSALIETPSDFLLFLARERTDSTLTTASVSVQKRTFDDWLRSQKPPDPRQ